MSENNGWLPIESAPKDTTTILGAWPLIGKRYAMQPIWWAVHSATPRWLHSYSGEEVGNPTHWHPLPPPPETHPEA